MRLKEVLTILIKRGPRFCPPEISGDFCKKCPLESECLNMFDGSTMEVRISLEKRHETALKLFRQTYGSSALLEVLL
jgi:hypothetical protein